MPSFAPKTRVEVYLPVRYEAAYQETLAWVIREFTELHGGCTVIENAGGYYEDTARNVRAHRIALYLMMEVVRAIKERFKLDEIEESYQECISLLKEMYTPTELN